MQLVNPYTCDCQALVVAYELRRRGIDICARPAIMYELTDEKFYRGFAMMMHMPNLIWRNPVTQTAPDIFPLESVDMLDRVCGPDERYHLLFDTPFSSHIIDVERYKGEVYAYDPAGGFNAPAREFFARKLSPTLLYRDLMSNLRYYRVDDCEIFDRLAEQMVIVPQNIPNLHAMFHSPIIYHPNYDEED